MFKKIAIILISVFMVLSFIPINAGADQTSDTFDITVTGEFLWIDITNLSWAIGAVAMSSSHWTNETGITFIADMEDTTVTADLKLQITNDGAEWSATTTGNAPDTDIYRLNNSIDTWGAENETLVGVATTISASIANGNNESFDLRFDAPTSTSVATQQTITVTATVVKS